MEHPMFNFDSFQALGKDNVDAMTKSFAAQQKTAQAIATEAQGYSKKQLEAGSQLVEKLLGVKTLDKAIELQSDFAKTQFEGFVAYATKVGEMVQASAKEAAKPFEAAFAKAAK
jgi:phasin family protein